MIPLFAILISFHKHCTFRKSEDEKQQAFRLHSESTQLLETQNKLTLSNNYSKSAPWGREPASQRRQISWGIKKLPPVLTVQSSTVIKAAARERTN
jgi:hypothetical protein